MSQSGSKTAELKTWERDTTLSTGKLRAAGYVPASLYGKGVASSSIQVRAHEFYQLYTQGVRTFQLTGYAGGTAQIKEVQFPPVERIPLSIQFWQDSGGGASGKSEKPGKGKGK